MQLEKGNVLTGICRCMWYFYMNLVKKTCMVFYLIK